MPDTPTLTELFARDPYSFTGPTDPDLAIIIARFREARKTFKLSGKGTTEKPKANLADLGI